MRRSPFLAVIVVVAAATPAVGATTARPTLRLLDRAPVTVTGRGFEPQETARVRLAVQGRIATRRAVTSASGTFRARFTISLGRCESFSLQAFGSEGSRARLFVTAPQPDCNSNN